MIQVFHILNVGIISACAEQTLIVTPKYHTNWDHLRVCGADLIYQPHPNNGLGSSPRVRSRLINFSTIG